MAFLVILRRTLVELTGPKGNLAILFIGVGISVLLSLAMGHGPGYYGEEMSIEMQTLRLTGTFLFIAFIWSAGFFLAIIVSVKGAGLIARESSDGTLTLLVSRPISRWQILAGKFAALVIYGILLDLIILLLSALIVSLIKPVTDETLIVLLRAILWLLPYILLITVIFGSISIALSTITNRRIAVTAILCAIVTVIFYFAPMVLLTITRAGPDGVNNYAYLNLSGHLGNIYMTIIPLIEGGHIGPGLYDSISFYITGNESSNISLPITGYSDLIIGRAYYPFEFVPILSPIISLGIWLSVIVLCLGTSIRSIGRKQVT